MTKLGTMLAAALLAMPAAAQAQDAGMGWLTGEWCTEAGDAGQTCESWSAEHHGTLTGVSTTVKDGTVTSAEEMIIFADRAGPVFMAKPQGQPAGRFALESRGAQELVFANAAHDYPQRVRYWRDGEALMAEISMADGSRPMRWRYLPKNLPANW